MLLIGFNKNPEWELVKEKDGIKVFQQKMENTQPASFKGEMYLSNSKQEAYNILQNMNNYKNWLPMLNHMEIIDSTANIKIAYVIIDAPWPLKDRDGYFQYTFNNNSTSLEIKALKNYQPKRRNLVRIQNSNSQWKIKAFADKQIKVIYESNTEIDDAIPKWLVRSKLISIPFESLLGLRTQLKN